MHEEGNQQQDKYVGLRGAQPNPAPTGCDAKQPHGVFSGLPVTSGLHERLWERRYSLQRQLDEVDHALNTLAQDESIKKLIMVLEVAAK